MKRREFVGGTCLLVAGSTAGCVTESDPDSKIDLFEVENHRPDRSHEFTVEIADGDDVVFQETDRLGPAGSGNDVVVFEDPVESGDYTIRVDAAGHSVSEDTQELISDEQTCLRLLSYLDTETLHLEPRLFDRCE